MSKWKIHPDSTSRPRNEVTDSPYDPRGIDELCASILRTAYEDLISALLCDAANLHKDSSYNCHLYYERLRRNEIRFKAYFQWEYKTTMDAQWEEAKEQITLMQKWFENSRWGKLYCQNVKGTWFVEQAHKHIEDFTHDRVMEEDIRISYALQDGDSQMIRDLKKRRELWREERNRWREEMCLEGVDDAVH